MFKKSLLISLFSITSTEAISSSLSNVQPQQNKVNHSVPKIVGDSVKHSPVAYTQTLHQQRETFLQFRTLLRSLDKQKTVSENGRALLLKMLELLDGYPLQADAQKLFFNSSLATEYEKSQFSMQNPDPVMLKREEQEKFVTLFNEQKFAELIEYANKVKPEGMQNQCRVLGAKFQLLSEKNNINPELAQAVEGSLTLTPEMKSLLTEFDQFWVENNLSSECLGLASFWKDMQFETSEKIQRKAVNLVKKNADKEIAQLALNSKDPALKVWLNDLQAMVKDPKKWQHFADNQPLTMINKEIVMATFPAFVRTLSEQNGHHSWQSYQQIADKFLLSASELRDWKILYLNRLFDHASPAFEQWRDNELTTLNADHLIERRLRTAIWQKTDLTRWLDLLSAETQNKSEWRYWRLKQAYVQKNISQAQKAELEGKLLMLSNERGFYPMLASKLLGKTYQPNIPIVTPLSDAQFTQFQTQLARIQELREIGEFSTAYAAWVTLMKAVDFPLKIALTDYAHQQNWYDLTVEGTIQAKAWDYLQLRLPNAYSEWFDLHLADKKIKKSFAMAIARQESAWNASAKSHANAIGLMQMLPSTAQATAKAMNLPYSGEQDLYRPFNNIMLGTAHLAELNEKYPNNRILIASAYNAGMSRVERWLARANNTLDVDEFIASIPFLETRGYVQNVLAYDYYFQILRENTPLEMFYDAESERKY